MFQNSPTGSSKTPGTGVEQMPPTPDALLSIDTNEQVSNGLFQMTAPAGKLFGDSYWALIVGVVDAD